MFTCLSILTRIGWSFCAGEYQIGTVYEIVEDYFSLTVIFSAFNILENFKYLWIRN